MAGSAYCKQIGDILASKPFVRAVMHFYSHTVFASFAAVVAALQDAQAQRTPVGCSQVEIVRPAHQTLTLPAREKAKSSRSRNRRPLILLE